MDIDAGVPVVLKIQVTVYRVTKPRSSNSPLIHQDAHRLKLRAAIIQRRYILHRRLCFERIRSGLSFALLLTPAVIGVIILLVWMIQSRTTQLENDEDTVRYETGVFSKDRRALNRRAIRTVRVSQSLLNRMLNVGPIEIFTASDVAEIRAVSMYAPNEIRTYWEMKDGVDYELLARG